MSTYLPTNENPETAGERSEACRRHSRAKRLRLAAWTGVAICAAGGVLMPLLMRVLA